jgi:Lon protease-like protein
VGQNRFDLDFEALPGVLPLFPLAGVLLLPHARLPLNIFEERYLSMVLWALGEERMIGMIQPRSSASDRGEAVYGTGCAGRITAFTETTDGRLLITLEGVARFDIREELEPQDGFRLIVPNWEPYEADLVRGGEAQGRERLLEILPTFFEAKGIEADWDLVASTDDEALVTTLAMICPLDPSEKQALLEAQDINARADCLITLIEIALRESTNDSRAKH